MVLCRKPASSSGIKPKNIDVFLNIAPKFLVGHMENFFPTFLASLVCHVLNPCPSNDFLATFTGSGG
jgi:hypothetical protein